MALKITQKQLYGYRKARREWISENDAYNVQHFGITKAQYNAIHRAVIDLVGIATGEIPSLVAINRQLAQGHTDYMTGRKFVD